MQIPEIGSGVGLGIGGTNYREVIFDAQGNPSGAERKIPTPTTPDEFFGTIAKAMLNASEQGCEWGTVGNPGPANSEVSVDGTQTHWMRVTNIEELNKEEGFDPVAEMTRIEPAFGRLVDSGFSFSVDNDGDEAAQAAAFLFGNGQLGEVFYNVIGAKIAGTGTGGSITRRDKRFTDVNLFHPDPGLWEVGHSMRLPGAYGDTNERAYSGTAIEDRFKVPPEKIDPNDPYWKEFTEGVGGIALDLALLGGAELVVISGGVGSGRTDAYLERLKTFMSEFRNSDNPMADRAPDIEVAPEEIEGVSYELFGARGLVLSRAVNHEIDKLVAAAD